ncbi:response regulator [Paenibacillus sp. LMG 31456]|uniref:Response regulator n=1 Tax=Paenibacillus foliorum TaxID=2654974 RepID=A0A972K0G1_9BACL|nr:response regulator [Paenibacillus foliorum]NOU93805.1 response regulator [Paenibacillus foliorum]
MNVLVVDDEPIIRQVLRTMISWEDHGLKWAGEAVDGEEAWESLQLGGIDLVVTDILMPRMDGLELVKRLKQTEMDVRVVVLSCLDDFAYVKEAMKQGASDYILKPTMEPEQLVATLTEAKLALQKQRDERRKQEELQEQLQQSNQAQRGIRLQKTWTNHRADEELEAEIFTGGAVLSSWIIYVTPAMRLSLAHWSWPSATAFVTLNAHQQLLLFENSGSDTDTDAYKMASEITAFLCHEGGLTAGSFCITAVSPIQHPERLRTLLQEHAGLRHTCFYSGLRKEIWAADVNDSSEAVGFLAEGQVPQEEKQNLLRAIAGRNEEAAVYWSEQVVDTIKQQEPAVEQVYSFIYELLGLAAAFAGQHSVGAGTDEFERNYVAVAAVQAHLQMDSLGPWFIQAIRELAGGLPGSGAGAVESYSRNPFVRKAMQYMQQNYHLQISTSDISEYVKLSRSYLSDLYGKEKGESLSESLTRIRIQAAKRLLEAGDMKVYEIAGAVGFSDAKAFAKTFKKAVGCSPKDYEERQNK